MEGLLPGWRTAQRSLHHSVHDTFLIVYNVIVGLDWVPRRSDATARFPARSLHVRNCVSSYRILVVSSI